MSKSVYIKARIDEVAKDLSLGMTRADIVTKYCKKFRLKSSRQIDNYISKARMQVEMMQELKKEATMVAVYEHEKAAETRRLLDRDEKRDILAKMALGEMIVKKIIFTKDGFKQVESPPDHADIRAAIDLDNKMNGDYAPEKKLHEFKGSVSPDKWLMQMSDDK